MEYGIVHEVKGDSVSVHIRRQSACGRCGVCMSLGDEHMQLWAQNTCGAKQGDRVVITLREKRALGAAAWAYGLPLLLMCVLAYAGHWLGIHHVPQKADFCTAAGIVVGLLAAYGLIYLFNKKKSGQKPQATAVVTDELMALLEEKHNG